MLGLVVVLVVFGRVLLGREGHVQGDLDLLHIRVVEVHGGEPRLAPLHAVQVGGDDVPQLAQALPVVGGRQLLLLVRQLPAEPGQLVGQSLMEGLAPGPHALGQGLAGIEVV